MKEYTFQFIDCRIVIQAGTDVDAREKLADALRQAKDDGAHTEYLCWRRVREKGMIL